MAFAVTINRVIENPGARLHSLGLVRKMEIPETELDPVYDELDRDRGQHESHQPSQDAHPRLAEPALDQRSRREHDVSDYRGQHDRDVDGDGRGRRFRARGGHQAGGDRAGSRQHRHAERHDTDVVLLDPLCRLDSGLALLAAARLDHVEGVEANEHTPRDFERADGDAEDLEDDAAARGERDERDRAGPRPSAREHAPLLRRVAHRHRQERGDDRERIHDEQDRREDQDELDRPLGHRTARSSPVRMRRIFAVGAGRSRSWARTRLYLPASKRIVRGLPSRTTSTTTSALRLIVRTAAVTSVPSMTGRRLIRTSSSPVRRPARSAALPGAATARQRPPCTAGGIEPTRASTSGASVNTTSQPAERRYSSQGISVTPLT